MNLIVLALRFQMFCPTKTSVKASKSSVSGQLFHNWYVLLYLVLLFDMHRMFLKDILWIQQYVCGEFVGGSDIMIEMYQSGELGEMIEKARADMM